ncbi:MAG: FISUMP domain-containing protein [Prolixibacteraceae bacterium]
MKHLSYCSTVLLFMFVFFNSACKKNTTDPATEIQETNQKLMNLEIGPVVEISSASISTGGGSVKISKADTPLNGMEIVIPANSFASSRTFKVSSAEIKSHQFGPNFSPVSPMINISCDGGYAKELMSVTIPVKIAAGYFPLGFYFDETTGKLEGIPVKSYTSSSVTLLTRHFLPASQLKSGSVTLKSAGTGSNIIISSISESLLTGQPIIASGFKPGVDDWEFANRGSYIAYGGHCAGQNITAMWYYFEKKPTAGNLNNKFSDNPKLWQDDARGYRFCSVIQSDLEWDGMVAGMFAKYVDKNPDLDQLKFYTTAGTMLITGEPQAIGIYRVKGTSTDGTVQYGGHALICYQIAVSAGKMYISDPNFPGVEQTIQLKNKLFEPYIGKSEAGDVSMTYPFITYYAKTAVIEWPKIAARYGELQDNTIGTVPPYTFPEYTIWQKEGVALYGLKDGLVMTNDTLRTMVDCPTAENFYNNVPGKKPIPWTAFDVSGNRIDNYVGFGSGYVILKPGVNQIGYYIYGWRTASKNAVGDFNDRFIDFKWITVNYIPLLIEPNPLNGEPSKEYTLTAKSKGGAPKVSKYTWDFGDGSSAVTVQNDSTVKHTFAKTGTFSVKVELYNSANNSKLTEAIGSAKIASNSGSGTFSYDGRTYAYKTIGTQTWMVENLAYLPSVSPSTQKSSTSQLYYVSGYQGTDVTAAKTKANYTTYGVLYNGPAALKACPPGWHLPKNREWRTLLDYLGTSAGGKMKETGTIHWSSPNTGATNSSGFQALAGGASSEQLGLKGVFWSASDDGLTNTLGLVLDYYSDASSWWDVFNPADAFSVRYIKD